MNTHTHVRVGLFLSHAQRACVDVYFERIDGYFWFFGVKVFERIYTNVHAYIAIVYARCQTHMIYIVFCMIMCSLSIVDIEYYIDQFIAPKISVCSVFKIITSMFNIASVR